MEEQRVYEKLQNVMQGLDISRIQDMMKSDYEDLVELRNRLNDDKSILHIYEEDIVLLDHILDYLEIFFKEVDINRYVVEVNDYEKDTIERKSFNDLSKALEFYQLNCHKGLTGATLIDTINGDFDLELISYCNENAKDICYDED